MARELPPPSAPASPETTEGHLKIGRRWIAKAMEQYPGLAVEDAVARVQRQAGRLAPRSVRRYRADLHYALVEHLEREGRAERFEAAWRKVDSALSSRKAHIPKHARRTSAKKITDATEQEVRALFYELKRHAIAHGNPNAILAALFVLVAGHAGFRPVELLGATLSDSLLTMPNAKKRPGHAPTRTLDISGLEPDVQKGIALMLSLIDHDLNKREFAKWQKVIANQMMRACKRIDIRILSLYSFRHVAIASWAAAGLSPQEIADLCGHISIRTAHTHYARADKGHKRRTVVRPVSLDHTVKAATKGQGEQAPARLSPPIDPQTRTDFEIEEMPEPRYRKDQSPPPMSPDEVARLQNLGQDDRDTAEIAASLRRARLRREVQEANDRSSARGFDPDEG